MKNELPHTVIEKLSQLSADALAGPALVGLDGYVDKIQRVIQRKSSNEVQYIPTIEAFSQVLAEAAGKSAQIGLATQEVKLGGNAPIMAHALGALGIKNYCLGSFGERIHSVFQTVHPNCQLLSLGEPAETNALEFNDGKIILSETTPFDLLNWETVKAKLPLKEWKTLFDKSPLIALVDWCNVLAANDIWRGILEEVLPSLETASRLFFFDLADPSGKLPEELVEALDIISQFKRFGVTVLGLNENEADKVYAAYVNEPKKASLWEKVSALGERINVQHLLVHPLDCCLLVSPEFQGRVRGRLVSRPKISTGGGDNLNAGYCFALLQGFTPEEAAVVGMATSGAYVSSGKSPDREAVIAYIRQWSTEIDTVQSSVSTF